MSARRWTAAAALLALAAGAGSAAGQKVIPGFARVNQSDITGPSVTSSDMVTFEPGTVQSLDCAAAWGVLDQGRTLRGQLDSLRLAGWGPSEGRTPSAAAQRDVALLLSGGPGAAGAGARIAAALTSGNRRAHGAVSQLVDVAEGLLATIARMDPLKPARAAPTQLHRSVGAWDEFIDASSPGFLSAPPDEFLALQSVLGRLDAAAIEHAARAGDPHQVDAFGAACAPPRVEQPVVELEFAVCALDQGDFRDVRGVYLPARGDSLVVVNGERRPLREVYPDSVGYAAGAAWFARDTTVQAFGRRYLQWGMSRVVRPGELVPAGRWHGVPVFTSRAAAAPPDVIYLPFRRGCEVQPYRRVEEARKVRG